MELKGSVTIKKTGGKSYYIHQYRDGDVVRNKTLAPEEAYSLAFKLRFKKNYDLKEIEEHIFKTEVQYADALYSMLGKYRAYKRRYAFNDINKFLHDENAFGKVLALYGLRRTGKTTLIFQNIIDMGIDDFSKTAFIQISSRNKIDDLVEDLRFLTSHGFKYIFIDEVTLLEDFISIASIFSDVYGLKSKIVLSGTDSLGFMIAKSEELYNRVIIIHTTYIPYKEFSDVLGIDSIDKYIEYGGLMTIEGEEYNQKPIFDETEVNEYVDSAIAHNIEHSLKYYNDGDHLGSLYKLYEKHELTNVINRIVEDTNHRFAIEVIEEAFKSHDYGSLKNLLLKDKNERVSTSLDDVNEEEIISLLMKELDIINKEKQINKIDDDVLKQVEIYLDILDLCKEIDVVNIPTFTITKKKAFIQPGLRFAQAKALLNILMKQEKVMSLPIEIREFIKDKLLSDIKGKMLEEIVLYQTYCSNPNTFKISFPIGEIDMVTYDSNKKETNIYEVKYSSSIHPNQYRYLIDESNNDIIMRAYYPISVRAVLYRGNNQVVDNIQYINVEEYLKNL